MILSPQAQPKTHFDALPVQEKIKLAKRITQPFQGVSILPIRAKIPTRGAKWSKYTEIPTTSQDLRAWSDASGFAIAPTRGSHFLIIDIDDPSFIPNLFQTLPTLKNTFAVERGPNLHLYVYTHTPLPSSSLSLQRNGGGEIASLRSHGAYAVGPYSDHQLKCGTFTGDHYIPTDPKRPVITLSEKETHTLFALFKSKPSMKLLKKPHAILRKQQYTHKDIERVEASLQARQWREGKDHWIKGQCIFGHNHKRGDKRPSATFNTKSGVYNCFACGRHSLGRVLNILEPNHKHPKTKTSKTKNKNKQATFRGELKSQNATSLHEKTVECELNIALALRTTAPAAAKLYFIIHEESKTGHGKHTYTRQDLKRLYEKHNLSPSAVRHGIKAALKHGLVEQNQNGSLRKVSIRRVKEHLGLEIGNENHCVVQLTSSHMQSTGTLSSTLTLIGTHFLPKSGLCNAARAQAMSIGKTTLIRHENQTGVLRKTNTRYLGTVDKMNEARSKGILWNVHFLEVRQGNQTQICNVSDWIDEPWLLPDNTRCIQQLPSTRQPPTPF